MSKPSQRDPHKEQFWRSKIQQQQTSGLNVRDFCRQQKISEPNFYAWRRELVQRDAQTQPQQSKAKSNSNPPVFIPVQLQPDSEQSPIEILLPNQVSIRLPSSVEPQILLAILTQLQEQA